MTEREILDTYWDYWKSQMLRKYKDPDHYLITEQNCIDDWVIMNWAIEEKD